MNITSKKFSLNLESFNNIQFLLSIQNLTYALSIDFHNNASFYTVIKSENKIKNGG